MKIRSVVFLVLMAAGVLLAAGIRRASVPVRDAGPAVRLADPLPPEAPAATGPTETGEARLRRWSDLSASPAGLATVSGEILTLGAADFPQVVDDAYLLAGGKGNGLLRLLCIRWAECDGEASLTWARDRYFAANNRQWSAWIDDLATTWFARSPGEAGAWFTRLFSGDRSERDRWINLGFASLEGWASPGNAVEITRALLAKDRGSEVWVDDSVIRGLSAAVTSRREIEAMRKLVAESGAEWPRVRRLPDGSVATGGSGHPGLVIASVFEDAWPRVDPEGWRQYAAERVTGANGKNLLLELAVSDCAAAADPAAAARTFLASPAAGLASSADLWRLLDAVELKAPGAGWELVRTGEAKLSAASAAQLCLQANGGDYGLVTK